MRMFATLRRLLSPVLVSGVALMGTAAVGLYAQAGAREATIYVSAVDQKGEPIPNLALEDVEVREDGVPREVLRVSHAVDPMDIAVLVDDSASSEGVIPRVREGLAAFNAKMNTGSNQIALIALADRPHILVDYTSTPDRFAKGISLLWPRSQSGSTLLDALFEVSRGLQRRDTPRAIIVAIVTDGGDFSSRRYEQTIAELGRAQAALHVISVGNFTQLDDDELRNRARMLSEGTTVTGGQRVNVLTPTAVQPALERLARELSSQYKVVFGRPESLIPPKKTDARARRTGLTLRGTLERATGRPK